MVGGLSHRVEHERVVDVVAAAEGVVDVDAGAGHVEEDVVAPGGVLERVSDCVVEFHVT